MTAAWCWCCSLNPAEIQIWFVLPAQIYALDCYSLWRGAAEADSFTNTRTNTLEISPQFMEPLWSIIEFSNCGINVHQHKLYIICGCGEKPKKIYSPERGRIVCKDLELLSAFLTKLPAQSPFQLERTWQFIYRFLHCEMVRRGFQQGEGTARCGAVSKYC